jgi:hypothetical protein
MRLLTAAGTELWLAYGMNVHPGGTVASTEEAIRTTVLPLKARLRARGPFGVALRLGAEAVTGLAEDERECARLRGVLDDHRLVPFTANGFVAGSFHGRRLKDEVYRPSWHEAARVEYTLALAEVMAALRGSGHTVSISTAPGSWRAWEEGRRAAKDRAHNLVACARRLMALEERTGTRVLLGLEAEPRCTIETTRELLTFFQGPLRTAFGRDRLAARHLGACFDVCHHAVMHEDLEGSLALLEAAGVPVVKVQASSALEVPDPRDPAAMAALRSFAEPVYLHQVAARDPAGARHVAEDLPQVLGDAQGPWMDLRPWRVHFHVPVFRETLVPPLRTTQPDLRRVLALVAKGGVTEHLEIETYSFGVLPEAERTAGSGRDLVDALAREYEWVLSVLEGAGAKRAAGEA